MKIAAAIAFVGVAGVGSAQACPFAKVGGGFAKEGFAPMFNAQDKFKGPWAECDEFGTCVGGKKGRQNLEGNIGLTGPSALANSTQVCIDSQPPKSTGFKSCGQAVNTLGGCATVTAVGACNQTCAVCSPVFVSQYGKRSGTPYDIEQDGEELAYGANFYFPKLERKKCKPYPLQDVVEMTRTIFENNYANLPAAVRMGFHDAGDYNKWTATGGADGRFATSGEDWYGQSRTTNQGTVCVKQLLGEFSHTSLSAGDAVQICAIVAVEVAGGPAFEDFDFLPGRAKTQGVTNDGMLPNPNGAVATLRDYYYRMGLNDKDIVVLMGGHTLGGGAGAAGSGYTGNFTPNTRMFNNEYFKLLVAYENSTDLAPECDYWKKTPAQRGANGGCHVGPMENLQLPTDRALLLDPVMREYVFQFAQDESLWFREYARSYKKLSELGMDVSVSWCNYN